MSGKPTYFPEPLIYTYVIMEGPSPSANVSVPRIIIFRRKLSRLSQGLTYSLLSAIFLFFIHVTPAYVLQTPVLSGSVLQQDYNAAQSAQSAGELGQAAIRYKLFVVQAMDLLGNNFTQVGDYADASVVFDEGLLLDPNNAKIRVDYAQESVASGDLKNAQKLAQEAIRTSPRDASAHLSLGRILLLAKDNKQAQHQLEIAVALDPNYPDGLALARADLALKNEKSASIVFSEMLKGFGDTAQLHMDIGLAYAETGHPEKAIAEFKRAIAKNDRLPGAHYSLGASYIQSMGEIDFPLAEAEFKKELQISPNDFLSYSQLGYIALAQHRFQEADQYLSKAATLNPQDPDVFLSLGQLYTEMKKTNKAEEALKTSILLTHDTSHNHYQVQRSHYLLARLLLQNGKIEEGRQQMQISEELMKEVVRKNHGKPSTNPPPETLSSNSAQTTTFSAGENRGAIEQARAYKTKIGPAIADSYNNLGVISASAGDFAESVRYFQNAARWNPQLPGIDYNLGKAAYYASQYNVAIPPLRRYVGRHPQEKQPRLWLAKSLAQHP